jgi:pyruvate-ferredoxin/flavodoxin oxidoreductase
MKIALDGNEAASSVAYRASEIVALYPITPASPMGEHCDVWSSEGKTNLFGAVPSVVEMQSEAGAAGLLHGALQTGALGTTFTSSQGLLLMIPDMYRMAGELTPVVIHVAARALATHALSIFGDHSDVMAARSTGFAMLCASSVQEAHDLAAIAHRATLESRIPFLHFFDGFRTSHEVAAVEPISDEVLKRFLPADRIAEHRKRALSPDHPVLRGTAQNPDVYFQARERVSPYYAACPSLTQQAMDAFAELTGRKYRLFDYFGAPDADRLIILMGSAAGAAEEAVEKLNAAGEKVGLLKVRLFRPFDQAAFAAAIPKSVKRIAVLDRTKEPGAIGEPLYVECRAALKRKMIGGRYGLASKEMTPAMVRAVYQELANDHPRTGFTVGIEDDISGSSLRYDPSFDAGDRKTRTAIFYGIGSDGTVGTVKSTAKILIEGTGRYAQGYFVYDSKKSGSITASHLRFGPNVIRSSYLIDRASFVACHHERLLEHPDVLARLGHGATLLVESPDPSSLWDRMPRAAKEALFEKRAELYAIDARRIAREHGLGGHIGTIMQACFFALSNQDGGAEMEKTIRAAYGKRGEAIVNANLAAIREAPRALREVQIPRVLSEEEAPKPIVRDTLRILMRGEGDRLPVSAFSPDGTFETGTACLEKRNLADALPVWSPGPCIQCGKCSFVCPHAALRIKAIDPDQLETAPAGFLSTAARDRELTGLSYTIQIAPEDCTGCSLCTEVCPAEQALVMTPKVGPIDRQRESWNFFLELPEIDRARIKTTSIRQQQLEQPLFEFSGACTGCGETPYLKLLSQLYGDRALIANATGCSSIFGGNLPTTPWTKDACGRGPAWSNSLFEDNAEFGLGFRVSLDHQRTHARDLLAALEPELGGMFVRAILDADESREAGIFEQRRRVAELKTKLAAIDRPEAHQLLMLVGALVKKSVWIVGGDGWAYDIGFGGLDHVLASGKNVNVLVLDTEVYSNTGGQMSKSTPLGAVARFAANGKRTGKKDLGLMAMTYGNVYVARVAMGAKDEHTLRAFIEAESYDGPSLIIAYSHCIAHGFPIANGLEHQRAAVESGEWLLYRYDPRRAEKGEAPLVLDSKEPKISVEEYLASEDRFRVLERSSPEEAKKLFAENARRAEERRKLYVLLASHKTSP